MVHACPLVETTTGTLCLYIHTTEHSRHQCFDLAIRLFDFAPASAKAKQLLGLREYVRQKPDLYPKASKMQTITYEALQGTS